MQNLSANHYRALATKIKFLNFKAEDIIQGKVVGKRLKTELTEFDKFIIYSQYFIPSNFFWKTLFKYSQVFLSPALVSFLEYFFVF